MVDKLLEEVQDKHIPLSNLLRKAKVLANRLDEQELLTWINKELSGYGKKEDVPEYRMMHGEVKAWNPYHGWVPVLVPDPEPGEYTITSRGAGQSVTEIEELLLSDGHTYEMHFSDSAAAQILADGPFQTKVSLFISRASLVGILNAVRNKLFDWLLVLDKTGVKMSDEEPNLIPLPATELAFDESKSLLTFKGRAIEISKTRDSDPHYLLLVLFKDVQKEWAYDELWEQPYFGRNNRAYEPKTDWRKLYNAGYSVNEKVAKATTISDFLVIAKTAMTINKAHL